MNEIVADFIEFKIYNLNESDARSLGVMQALLVTMSELVESLCLEHLWQCDVFRLSLIDADEARGVPMHFGARLEVGDNIEDEWFVMYLLRDISRRFAQLAVSAIDSDGHFLLIEAAHELPAWLDPDCSEHRLFLAAGGKWVLLDESRDTQLSLSVALRALRARLAAQPSCHEAAGVARVLNARIDVHPQRAREQSTHRIRVRVPPDVAIVLDALPQLVAPAVALFYAREPSDIASSSRLQHFRALPLVDVRVRFSRCLYAQMARQRFFVPRDSPFLVPADESHVDYKAAQIGMQLTFAFEMLACRATARRQRQQQKPNSQQHQQQQEQQLQQPTSQQQDQHQTNISCEDETDAIRAIRSIVASSDASAFAELERMLCAYKRLNHTLTRWLLRRFDPDDEDLLYTIIEAILQLKKQPKPTTRNGDATTESNSSATSYEVVTSSVADDDESWMDVTPEAVDSTLKMRFDELNDVDLEISSSDSDNSDNDDKDNDTDEKDTSKRKAKSDKFEADGSNEMFDGKNFDTLIDLMRKFVAHESTLAGVETGIGQKKRNKKSNNDDKDGDDDGGEDDDVVQFNEAEFVQVMQTAMQRISRQGLAEMKAGGVDDADEIGMDLSAYDEAMRQELASTTMANSFVRVGDAIESSTDGASSSTSSTTALKTATKPDVDDDDDDRPIDVNVNLVKNLMDSFLSQGGTAGPAQTMIDAFVVDKRVNKSESQK